MNSFFNRLLDQPRASFHSLGDAEGHGAGDEFAVDFDGDFVFGLDAEFLGLEVIHFLAVASAAAHSEDKFENGGDDSDDSCEDAKDAEDAATDFGGEREDDSEETGDNGDDGEDQAPEGSGGKAAEGGGDGDQGRDAENGFGRGGGEHGDGGGGEKEGSCAPQGALVSAFRQVSISPPERGSWAHQGMGGRRGGRGFLQRLTPSPSPPGTPVNAPGRTGVLMVVGLVEELGQWSPQGNEISRQSKADSQGVSIFSSQG